MVDEKTTEILQHRINYWYRDDFDGEMDECDIEHIEKLIKGGYIEGELVTTDPENPDESHWGWWGIVKE